MEPNYTTRIFNYALKSCGFYPLRPMQLSTFDLQLTKARSTMLNLNLLIKLDDEVDTERLARAFNDVLNSHDIFRCRFAFHPGTSDLCQRFDGEISPVTVEKISDKEFALRRKSLCEPYPLTDSPLYRIYLFETPTAKYLYVDFHHTIMDGYSMGVLLGREIDLRYRGKPPRRSPPQYADLVAGELLISADELARGNAYWRDMLKGFDVNKHLPPSDVVNPESAQEEILFYEFENITSDYFKSSRRSDNDFLLAATMIAIAKSAGSKDAIMSWIHTGRTNMQEYRIMGLMIDQFPIAWTFDDDMTVGDYLNGIEEQIKLGMKYRRSLEVVYTEGLMDDCAGFILQKGNISSHNDIFTVAGKSSEVLELVEEGDYTGDNSLDFEFHAEETGRYSVELAYVTIKYSEEFMLNFAQSIDEILSLMQDENNTLGKLLH